METPPKDVHNMECFFGDQYAEAKASAVNGIISSDAWGEDHCSSFSDAANTAASTLNYHVHLVEGTVEYCEPTIVCDSLASGFKLKVDKNGAFSHAFTGGLVSVGSPCGDSQAAKAIKIGEYNPESVTLGPVTFPIDVTEEGGQVVSAVGPVQNAPENPEISTNHIVYNIASQVDVRVQADIAVPHLFVIRTGSARAQLWDAFLGIQGTAKCGQGRCADFPYSYGG